MGEETPTPWNINLNSVVTRLFGYPHTTIAELRLLGDAKTRRANARRIVTAVNAHDDLVAALERLHRNFRLMLSARPVRDVAETEAEVLAALAKAQGE